MSNDFWRGWWWSQLFHGSDSKPVQPQGGGGPGCLILMIGWPLLLECVLVGSAVFQFVSLPPGTSRRG